MKLHMASTRLAAMGAAVSFTLLLGACATPGKPPVAELATARASIAQAESAGATEAAPVELLAAREKFGKAEAAVREERFAEARWLAEAAEADAEVAERKARVHKAEAAAAALARSNEALRMEAARKARP